MKTKDYVFHYSANPNSRTLSWILNIMLTEYSHLLSMRNVSTNSGRANVLIELHEKWQAFAIQSDDKNIDQFGFLKFFIMNSPQAFLNVAKFLPEPMKKAGGRFLYQRNQQAIVVN